MPSLATCGEVVCVSPDDVAILWGSIKDGNPFNVVAREVFKFSSSRLGKTLKDIDVLAMFHE